MDDGQQLIYQRFIAPASASVRFTKALNRSVTGPRNDLIFHAKVWLVEGELSPYDVGFKLNEIPRFRDSAAAAGQAQSARRGTRGS